MCRQVVDTFALEVGGASVAQRVLVLLAGQHLARLGSLEWGVLEH